MATLRVTSSAFPDGGMIPDEHTCDGQDVSPPLTIEGVPGTARSLALILDDPDSAFGTWVHWLVWDVPATHRAWAAGADLEALGARQGQTSWTDRRPAYYGPCPMKGTHRYRFHVYALDAMLQLAPGAERATLEAAMQGHVLAEGILMGRYVKRVNRS